MLPCVLISTCTIRQVDMLDTCIIFVKTKPASGFVLLSADHSASEEQAIITGEVIIWVFIRQAQA